jgi:hypothetical protein
MTPQLPSEIMDEILDLIRDDRHLLATCGAVCKAWLPRTRHHLIDNDLLISFAGAAFSQASDVFLELIKNSTPTITPHIRHLNLHERPGHDNTRNGLSSALPRLAPLTAVEGVYIRDAKFRHWEGGALTNFLFGFHIRDLRMCYGIRFGTFAELVEAVSACPNLEHLTLHVVSWVDKGTAGSLHPSSAQKVPSCLHSLELGSCNKGSILN